jgi:hypothetical protein
VPTFIVSGPDGKQYRITGPEGSTQEDAIARVQQGLGLSQSGQTTVEQPQVSGDRAPLQITVNPGAKPEANARPDGGRVAAAIEGMRSATTFNFGDELAGVAGAAPVPPEMRSPLSGPANFIMGLGQLGYDYLRGSDAASKNYEKARDEVRELQKSAEEHYPGTYITGQIGGGLLLPLGGALNAATLPARMGRGAALGSLVGGLSGVGGGETLEGRAAGGAIGSGVGLGIGAVAPPLIEGGAAAIRAAVSTPLSIARSALNPEAAAERAIGRAYQNAVKTDPSASLRLDPTDLAPGSPARVVDTLGREGQSLARSAANLNPGARTTLDQTLEPRYEGQGERFKAWFNQSANFPDAHAQQLALKQSAKAANDANYTAARSAGDHPVRSAELDRLLGSPVIQDAIKAAIQKGKDRAILEGHGGFNSPYTITQDGRLVMNKGPNGVPTYPNLQFWDYVRREVSNLADKAKKGGGGEDFGLYSGLAKQLNNALDKVVPSYAKARSVAAEFFGAENALEAGQKFVRENFSLAETRAALAKMSPTERKLFQDGFVSRLVETLDTVPNRADVTNRIYNTPAAKEKIELVLGKQKALELEAMIRVENIMQQVQKAVAGNSTTVAQILGAGAAGGVGGQYLGYDPSTSGFVAALLAGGKKGVDYRVAERVAKLLVSDDPATLNRGIKMIATNQTAMRMLRSADSAGARVGGYHGASFGGQVQAPAIARGEDK